MAELTPKQQRFVAEYLIDLNGTQAAIRAGYSPATANEQAARLLAKDSVSQAVSEAQKASLERIWITADRVKQELARLAVSDVRGYVDAKGHLKNLHDLTDDQAAALASIEVTKERTYTKGNEDSTVIEYTTKVKSWDKLKALDLLSRHFGLLKDDAPAVQVNVLTKVERVIVKGK